MYDTFYTHCKEHICIIHMKSIVNTILCIYTKYTARIADTTVGIISTWSMNTLALQTHKLDHIYCIFGPPLASPGFSLASDAFLDLY